MIRLIKAALTFKKWRKEAEQYLGLLTVLDGEQLAKRLIFATHIRHEVREALKVDLLRPCEAYRQMPGLIGAMEQLHRENLEGGQFDRAFAWTLWIHTIRSVPMWVHRGMAREMWDLLISSDALVPDVMIGVFKQYGEALKLEGWSEQPVWTDGRR